MSAVIKVTGAIVIRAPTLHAARKLWQDLTSDGAERIEAKSIELTVCPKAKAAEKKKAT